MLLSALLILAQPNDLPQIALKAMQCRPAALCSVGGPQEQLEPHVARAITKLGFRVLERDAIEAMLIENNVSRAERDQLCHSEGCLTQLQDALGALGIEYLVVATLNIVGKEGRAELFLTLRSQGERSSLSKEYIEARTVQKLKPQILTLVKNTMRPLLRGASTEDYGYDDDEGGSAGPVVRGGSIRQATGGLQLSGRPDRAAVVLSGPGGEKRTRIGARLRGLRPGVYRWQAQARGYESGEGTVTVAVDEMRSVEMRLRKLASLRVKGRPARSKVVVKGPEDYKKKLGIGGRLNQMPLGEYRIQVSKRGYETEFRRVHLGDGADETIRVILKPPGSLAVEGRPHGALVEIQGPHNFEAKEGLPVRIDKLPRGDYRVVVSRGGYRRVEKQVEVRSGKMQRVRVDLRKIALGALRVSGYPTGAEVTLEGDGRSKRARLPAEWSDLRPGSYQVHVEHSDHRGRRYNVRVRADRMAELEVELPRSRRGRARQEEEKDEQPVAPNFGSFDFGYQYQPMTMSGIENLRPEWNSAAYNVAGAGGGFRIGLSLNSRYVAGGFRYNQNNGDYGWVGSLNAEARLRFMKRKGWLLELPLSVGIMLGGCETSDELAGQEGDMVNFCPSVEGRISQVGIGAVLLPDSWCPVRVSLRYQHGDLQVKQTEVYLRRDTENNVNASHSRVAVWPGATANASGLFLSLELGLAVSAR